MTVIVTGAGGTGCGQAIAARFARDRAPLIVADIAGAGGHRTVDLITRDGGRAAFCGADVRDEGQIRELIAFGERTFGGVTVMVNNASESLALRLSMRLLQCSYSSDFAAR